MKMNDATTVLLRKSFKGVYRVSQKISRLTKSQTIVFCFIVQKFFDSKCLLIDLDFDTSTTQID